MTEAAQTVDDVLRDIDLRGTVIAVTGASGGLGLETARALASRNADVLLLVRDPARVDPDSVGPYGHFVAVDLASLASIRTCASGMRERWPRLDALVNNAGVMATPQLRTVDGFDLQLGTNHLGHFLLTALLRPILAENSRVVNVSSLGHKVSGMLWEDPHFLKRPYNPWEAYGQSKTANILFTRGLAARGITSYAVHPGRVATNLYRHLGADATTAPAGRAPTEVTSPAQGATTIVWATTADGIPSGSYLADCKVAEAAPHATDAQDAERLWAWSEEQVGQRFD